LGRSLRSEAPTCADVDATGADDTDGAELLVKHSDGVRSQSANWNAAAARVMSMRTVAIE